jgi:diguanylate cyclase (GGDEF)-like protein
MVRRSGKDLEPLLSECRLIDKSGEIHWIRSMARPVRGSNGAVVWNGVAVDITPEKATEERLSYLADHDRLTGLLNRGAFRRQLSEYVAKAQAESGAFGVLSIDISHFQPADDSSGSVMDDSIMQIVAERITRFDWVKLAARVGGAEFAVVLANIEAPGGALAHADALRREITKPIEIAANRIAAHTAMGLALYPNHNAPFDSSPNQIGVALIKAAGVAMFTAKRAGLGYCHVYSPDDVDRIRDRAVLWQTLFEAYENRHFVLNYRPIVDLKSGRILGARAFVHWSHPKLRVLRYDQLTPLAEKMGLIASLGAWVLEETLQNLRQWADSGSARPVIAINIDAAQLQNPEAYAEMSARILASDVNSTQIEIELNERDLVNPTPTLLANLASLRESGITVAIDGFAAGYSLFRNPRSLPIDKIRLDPSLVSQMTDGSGEEAIVRGMIAIAGDLGLTVIAEGVETSEQRDILLREGCRIGQGNFYSAPVTAREFGWMLREQVGLPMTGSTDGLAATPGDMFIVPAPNMDIAKARV